MNRNDEITLNISVAEGIRIYAAMGKVNGLTGGPSAWAQLRAILDEDEHAYSKYVYPLSYTEARDFASYGENFIGEILARKELPDLIKQRDKIQEQIDKLLWSK